MSVAEKLKTLEADVETIQEVLTEALACDSLDRISGALPQLIAVVEAAEQGRGHSLLLNSEPAGVQMLGWRVQDARALNVALNVLDETLTTKGEQ